MKPQRIKAFTIMEVTVTMLIAAILMGITYTTYLIVSKSYLSFNTKNTAMAEVELLDKLLKRDFDRAVVIQKTTEGIVITNTGQTIRYGFTPDFITRASGITDTFKVKTDSLNTLFEGASINETGSSGEQNRLDELSFILIYQNQVIPYHYHKQYSSENLIQRNNDAIH